jgi:endonuclease/exonuclease/phosphatase (EEP) superfamily protein YafD
VRPPLNGSIVGRTNPVVEYREAGLDQWKGFRGLVLALLTIACAGGPASTAPRVLIRGPVLRVLTYNVNFGLVGDRETIAAVRDADVDLALLQETNSGWERALRAALSRELPQMIFENRGGGGGLAVLSRLPLAEVEFLRPTASGWFPAVRVVVDTSFGKVQALSVHLHPPVSDTGSLIGGYFTTRGVRAEEIHAFFAKLSPALPTLVAGDFNEESDGEVTRYLVAKGMVSALPPDQPTWRRASGVGTIRKQLDHIMHDRRLETVAADVRVVGHSDHLPVIGIFQLAKTSPGHD